MCVPFVIQLWFALGLADTATFGGPTLLFWVVVIAAGLCAVVAAALMWYSVRTDAPELSWVGLYFWAASVLPLVHGITTPGVLYGENAATMSSVQWSVPVALLLAWPLHTMAEVVPATVRFEVPRLPRRASRGCAAVCAFQRH